MIKYFFFQAEDGIRDYKVTEFRRVLFRSNLQEKRIAITGSRKMAEMSMMVQKKGGTAYERPLQETIKCKPEDMQETLNDIITRSEERRVGKEIRYKRKTNKKE